MHLAWHVAILGDCRGSWRLISPSVQLYSSGGVGMAETERASVCVVTPMQLPRCSTLDRSLPMPITQQTLSESHCKVL